MQFPPIDAESLDGQALSFPRDFGTRTIALIAFDLKARTQLDSWIPFVDAHVRSGAAQGRVFPVLARPMRVAKGMILTAMRKAIPFAEARAATVPVFVDIDPFCAALEIVDRAAIHVVVIASGGAILTHHAGPYTPAAGAAIDVHLAVSA